MFYLCLICERDKLHASDITHTLPHLDPVEQVEGDALAPETARPPNAVQVRFVLRCPLVALHGEVKVDYEGYLKTVGTDKARDHAHVGWLRGRGRTRGGDTLRVTP